MSDQAIAEYALLSDCHSGALVDRSGSVDWLCFPRFDAPAQLTRLLDANGGHWSLRPTSPYEVERRYVDGSLVLETTFHTQTGELILRDALSVGLDERGHNLGAQSPHMLLREAHCPGGTLNVELVYLPRPEYGLITPLLRPMDGGILTRGGASVLVLSSPVPLHLHDSGARTQFRLRQGERVHFALQYRSTSETVPKVLDGNSIERRLEDTIQAWQSWSAMHRSYDGPWREQVLHSGRVLQGLTYYPTGAIVAAATTSLPEVVGGSRNWDYRFTWVRDASLTMEALWVAACPDESHRFFDFIAQSALTRLHSGRDMQIMYGVGGEHDLTERELPHLSGWRQSAPVRVGNQAWNQRQIDVYGEVITAAYRLKDVLGDIDPVTRNFLSDAAEFASSQWREKDQGIWEFRSSPRHFLHSKLMCWLALDRAIALGDQLNGQARVENWKAAREDVRRAILEWGWSNRLNAYTQAFGHDELDASVLMMPIVGFLRPDHPRMLATLDAIERELTDAHGLVYRYRSKDGLEGEEGTFLLCTFWLAHARALAGQTERAEHLFNVALGYANDVGLLSEQVCPHTGELLGNFPQAFSHIGLINAAWAIHQAKELRGPGYGVRALLRRIKPWRME